MTDTALEVFHQQLGVFLTHTFPFAHLNGIYRFSGLSATIQT